MPSENPNVAATPALGAAVADTAELDETLNEATLKKCIRRQEYEGNKSAPEWCASSLMSSRLRVSPSKTAGESLKFGRRILAIWQTIP